MRNMRIKLAFVHLLPGLVIYGKLIHQKHAHSAMDIAAHHVR